MKPITTRSAALPGSTVLTSDSEGSGSPIGEVDFDNVRLDAGLMAVNEPATLALSGLGLAGLGLLARRHRRRSAPPGMGEGVACDLAHQGRQGVPAERIG